VANRQLRSTSGLKRKYPFMLGSVGGYQDKSPSLYAEKVLGSVIPGKARGGIVCLAKPETVFPTEMGGSSQRVKEPFQRKEYETVSAESFKEERSGEWI